MLLRYVSNLKGIDKNDEVLLTCHIRVKKTQKKKKYWISWLVENKSWRVILEF